MKKKGFTLVELLVVIAIIALLMGILMPALARVRQLAHRLVCGTNLSGIGKAMLIYADENEGEYPRAGGRGSVWSDTGTILWSGVDELQAFGDPPLATITSSFYLLVRYAEVTPKQFVCKGDGAKGFYLSDYLYPDHIEGVEDGWDFGSKVTDNPIGSALHCSYSYHMPYGGFPINPSSHPSSPLCADRNPYLDKNAEVYLKDRYLADPYWDTTEGYRDLEGKGNSAAHRQDGQNVLFNDSHVTFEKYPNVGIENDNIWKPWPSADKPLPSVRQGIETWPTEPIVNGEGWPMAEEDAYLVQERNGPVP